MKPPVYNSKDGKPPINRKVIVISNQPGPPLVGTLVRYEPLTKSNCLTPVVRDEGTGREFITMGTVLPFSDRLMTMLQALPEDGKTWEIFRDIRWFRADMDHFCEYGEAVANEFINGLLAPPDPRKEEVLKRTDKIWQRVGKFLGI